MSNQLKVKKRVTYSPSKMSSAISAVQEGLMSKSKASKVFGVPRTTLLDKLYGRVPMDPTPPGSKPELTQAEEKTLVNYITLMAEIGYPLTRKELLYEVKRVLDTDGRKTKFTDNLPGKAWYKAFTTRNPEISTRKPATLGHQRASISYEMVDGWYKGLFEYLEKEVPDFQKLIGDPKRIFNADESGFPISVTSKKVLAPQGSRHVYQVLSSDKTQITVMACLNASGDYMPPLIVYPGQRFRDDALSGFPEAIYGHSANGWMDSDLFLSFLREFNAFVDDKSIHKPVILFVDGHSTHISRVAAEYCADNSIILYCLLANATHVLQACDIGLFSPMKMKWSVAVKAWQMENLGQPFTKYHFPSVFKTAWDKVTTLANSISAFKRSGLYPLSIKGIDLSKLGPSKLSAPLIQPELTKSVNVDHVSMACTLQIPSSDSSSDPCTSSGSVPATVPSSNQAELTKSVNVDHVSMACTLQIPSSDSSSDPCTSSGSVQATVPSSNPSTDISVQQSTPLLQQPLKILSQNVRSPDYVSPAFFKLRVPEIKAKKTNNTLRGKLPKALSGSVALKMMKERDEKKKKEEEEKQARKIERERKKIEREQEKEKKKRERELKKAFKKKMKCKKSDKCSDSENENEEMEISYMDDSDYDEAEVCPGCHSAEGLPEEWIGCDSCSRWWHIECTDIEEFVGKTASEISGYNFTCEFC